MSTKKANSKVENAKVENATTISHWLEGTAKCREILKQKSKTIKQTYESSKSKGIIFYIIKSLLIFCITIIKKITALNINLCMTLNIWSGKMILFRYYN